MSISSTELNHLIWRYLQESGFELSTYAFQKDANQQFEIKDSERKIPDGALVDLVQKGINYLHLQAAVKDRLHEKNPKSPLYTLLSALELERDIEPTLHESKTDVAMEEIPDKPNGSSPKTAQKTAPESIDAIIQASLKKADIRQPIVIYTSAGSTYASWHPKSPIIAFCTVESGVSLIGFDGVSWSKPSMELSLFYPNTIQERKGSTVLSWSVNGNYVVVGCISGDIFSYNERGEAVSLFSLHQSPIVSLKWSTNNQYILSIDCLSIVSVWAVKDSSCLMHCEQDTLDVSTNGGVTNGSSSSVGCSICWIDHNSFAASGRNGWIYVYHIGDATPFRRINAHQRPVNDLIYDANSGLLASASDDCTIKLWNQKVIGLPLEPITLSGHSGQVIQVCWLPLSQSLSGIIDQQTPYIASGSLDGTIKIWNSDDGECISTFNADNSGIISLALSPNGLYLASGSMDGIVIVWDVSNISSIAQRIEAKNSEGRTIAIHYEDSDSSKNGDILRNEPVGTLSWSNDSKRLFVGYSSKSVILDL